MEGGGLPNYVNLRNQTPVPPPLTAIGRFLQGQSRHNHLSHHNSDKNKQAFIPSNGVCEFSNGEIGRLYDESKVPLVPCFPMDKIIASHGIFSKNYLKTQVANEVGVFKRGRKMKFKGGSGGRKSVIKGQWSDEEDRMLLRLVKQHGVQKWANIAEKMIGRAGKQCRERWHNHLRPDIKKDSWSEDEERMLVEAHQKVGNKWAEISKLIPGRSENAIKNHWNATKRRQNSRRKTQKNEAKNRKFRSSILQEYIRSKITINASDRKKASTTTTTVNGTQGSSSTISSYDPSNKFNTIFPELPLSNMDDYSPSLHITQSYDDELTFMQTFFGDTKPITQDSNTISNESSIHTKDPESPLDMNPIELNHNPHCQFAPNSSFFNDSVYIKDWKSSLDMKPLYGFPSSSLMFNESSVHINLKSSFEENPREFCSNFLYGFASSSSVPHGAYSNLVVKQEDSLTTQLSHDVYISYLQEGSTTLSNSNDYGYFRGNKRDMVFNAEQSIGSSSSSNGDQKDMDLVEMVFSSQFSQSRNFLI